MTICTTISAMMRPAVAQTRGWPTSGADRRCRQAGVVVAARCAPVETESRDASQIKPESASTVTEGRSAAASALARRSLLLAAAGAVVAPPPLLPSQLLRGGAAPAAQAKVNVTKVEKAQSEGERDVSQAASGFRFSDAKVGRGEQPRTGDLVMVELIGRLENGVEFINTRESGAPVAFELGITNKYVPEGLSQAVESMKPGGVRLVVMPPSLGFGEEVVRMPLARIPPGSKLYYEIELLRCQQLPFGLACCPDDRYPCVSDADLDAMMQQGGGGA